MFKVAISAGISIKDYWDMTLGEIVDYLFIYQETEKNKAKELIASNYNLATLIATFVLGGMNGQEPPTLNSLYPNLFEEDNVEEDEDNQIAFLREQLNEFATQANKQRQRQ